MKDIKLEYRIVTPSRGRADVIGKRTLKLLPMATVVVHESEYDEYEKYNPTANIVRTKATGISRIRQWILDNFDEETIVMLDDDLKGVWVMVGNRQRTITETEKIIAIIENSIAICKDLGISLFGYSRVPNPMLFKTCDPLKFTGGIAGGIFGIVGRKLHFDTNIKVRGEDTDITLQAFLLDRIIYLDNRFYFNFGEVYSGKGGLQGLRNTDDAKHDELYLRRKWGKYLNLNKLNLNKTGPKTKKISKHGAHVNVERKSKLAVLR